MSPEIDLNRFCKKRSKVLCRPWSSGKFSFASNGVILVRVPRIEEIQENTAAPTDEKIESVFGGIYDRPGEWLKLPETEIKHSTCRVCGGSGKVRLCPECGGACFLYFDNQFSDYEVECATCRGIGALGWGGDRRLVLEKTVNIEDCENCDGQGHLVHDGKTKIGGVSFAHKALYLIQDLPNIEIKVFKETAPLKMRSATPAVFRFDGGIGYLMPLVD